MENSIRRPARQAGSPRDVAEPTAASPSRASTSSAPAMQAAPASPRGAAVDHRRLKQRMGGDANQPVQQTGSLEPTEAGQELPDIPLELRNKIVALSTAPPERETYTTLKQWAKHLTVMRMASKEMKASVSSYPDLQERAEVALQAAYASTEKSLIDFARDGSMDCAAFGDKVKEFLANQLDVCVDLREIGNLDRRDIVLEALSQKTDLRSLVIVASDMHDAAAGFLVQMQAIHDQNSALEELCLTLSNSNLMGDNVSRISHLTKLIDLDVSRNKIADDTVAAFSQLSNLRRLDLSRNSLTDAGLATVANLPELRHLDIRWNNISPNVAEATRLSFAELGKTFLSTRPAGRQLFS